MLHWIVSSEKVSYQSFDIRIYIMNMYTYVQIKLTSRRHLCLQKLKQNESSNKMYMYNCTMRILQKKIRNDNSIIIYNTEVVM